MGAADVFTQRNMRILNLGALLLATIAWVARFMYFAKREEMVEREVESKDPNTGKTITTTVLEKIEVSDSFWFIAYTLAVLPVLIFIFLIQELQVKNARLAPICRHFYFLDYYAGKAIYLLLIMSLIMQHTDVI